MYRLSTSYLFNRGFGWHSSLGSIRCIRVIGVKVNPGIPFKYSNVRRCSSVLAVESYRVPRSWEQSRKFDFRSRVWREVSSRIVQFRILGNSDLVQSLPHEVICTCRVPVLKYLLIFFCCGLLCRCDSDFRTMTDVECRCPYDTNYLCCHICQPLNCATQYLVTYTPNILLHACGTNGDAQPITSGVSASPCK